jgi:hypothetical protein
MSDTESYEGHMQRTLRMEIVAIRTSRTNNHKHQGCEYPASSCPVRLHAKRSKSSLSEAVCTQKRDSNELPISGQTRTVRHDCN